MWIQYVSIDFLLPIGDFKKKYITYCTTICETCVWNTNVTMYLHGQNSWVTNKQNTNNYIKLLASRIVELISISVTITFRTIDRKHSNSFESLTIILSYRVDASVLLLLSSSLRRTTESETGSARLGHPRSKKKKKLKVQRKPRPTSGRENYPRRLSTFGVTRHLHPDDDDGAPAVFSATPKIETRDGSVVLIITTTDITEAHNVTISQ